VSRKITLTIIAVLALIMAGFSSPATPADISINFNVTNPDFSITSSLTDHQTGNSNTTTVECSAIGSGYTYGGMEHNINTETDWNSMFGGCYGSEVGASTTFQVQSYRNVEGTSSTFTTTQTVSATNAGVLEFLPIDDEHSIMTSGLRLYGEGGACDTTDTWALGFRHTFEGNPDTVTGTAENTFKQRDPTGALIGTPVENQFTVDTATAEGDWFTGSGEGGSYETILNGQSQPGFGFAANNFQIEVKESGNPVVNLEVLFHSDQIVGDTITWHEHPDYPNP